MSSKPEWKKNVELLEARKEVLEKEIEDCQNKKFFKTYYARQIAIKEAEKDYIEARIADLNSRRIRNGVKLNKGRITGIIASHYEKKDTKLDEQIAKAEAQKTTYEDLASSIKTGLGNWEKKAEKQEAKIEKLKEHQVKVQGRQRTVLWPKYKKAFRKDFIKSAVYASHDYRQDRLNDYASASSKLNNGTILGAIGSLNYLVRGKLYKKRAEITEFFGEKLRNTIATFKGARSTIVPRKKFTSSFGTP